MPGHQVFLYGLISIISAIALKTFLSFPAVLIAGFFVFGILIFIKKDKTILLLFVLFLLGLFRAENMYKGVLDNKIYDFCDKQVLVTGKIIEEPVVFTLKTKLKIKTEYVDDVKITSKILVYVDNTDTYLKYQQIKWQGKLESVLSAKNGLYYKNQGISAIGNTGMAETIKDSPKWARFLFEKKSQMRDLIKSHLSDPLAGIMSAMILGDNFSLPEDVKTSLNQSGLRHIISISGTHISIIMSILMGFLLGIGFSRKTSGWLTIAIIVLYIVLIGFLAPAIRSAVMGAGIILAQIFGRLPDAFRFLLFAGAAMLLINPFLIFDIGFWLSFTATAGMIFFSKFFTSKIKKIVRIDWLSQVLGVTFSAQIFSLPIMLYFFGTSPIFAFFANMLVAPIIPFIIIFGFMALFLGLIFQPLVFIFFILIEILLKMFLFISDFSAQYFGLLLNFKINLLIVFASYILLGWWARYVKEKEKLEFLEY